ncbi:TNT domain-containing protein [Actinomadura viridis]|uniref:TNT domain-containing protein n=1 Tax=Actinomadura viridis TaxID=58110 RepID=UPI0036938747
MRVFRRGATSAAIFCLTVVLTGTAASARPDGAGTPRSDACATPAGGSIAEIIQQAEACSKEAVRPQGVPPSADAVKAAVKDALHAQPQVCGPPYVQGDPRLGPLYLPRTGYFAYLLRGYVRYGGLSPSEFLYQYWDENKVPAPDWRYPPDDGFTHELKYINSRPERSRVTLRVGQYIDRFGAETGRFLSPGGASFPSRALPPDSLNTRADDPAHLCNYHLYRVKQRFDVDGGPAEPAFQQRGRGLQYVLVGAYVPGAPSRLSVQWLADNGFLERVY